MDAGGRGEAGRVGVQRRALFGAIGGIECALPADLLQEPAAVMGIFLDHAARRARDPDVVVLVEVAGVQAVLGGTVAQSGDGALDEIGIAPGMDHRACGIELDHQRRQPAGVQVSIQHVLAIEQQHVVLGVDAMAAEAAGHPSVWEWLRKGDVYLVARRGALRPREGDSDTCSRDRRYGGDSDSVNTTHSHRRASRCGSAAFAATTFESQSSDSAASPQQGAPTSAAPTGAPCWRSRLPAAD